MSTGDRPDDEPGDDRHDQELPAYTAPEAVLRDAVCAFDNRETLLAETHTVDALVSAMRRRQWLSTEESLALHATLVAMFPRLSGVARPSRRLAKDTGSQVRKRPDCVPALIDTLASATTDPDVVLDALTEALTAPAGVRTDPEELRGALDAMVDRFPESPPLDDEASRQQYALHLVTCIRAAQGRLSELTTGPEGPAATNGDLAAMLVWFLLDALRDGGWRTEADLGSLRGSLLFQLRLKIPALEVGPVFAKPRLSPAISARVAGRAGAVLSGLQTELADLQEHEHRRAANLLVEALSALSEGVLTVAEQARPRAAVEGLHRTVAGTFALADSAGSISRQERAQAAQETIDALAGRVRKWPDASGLIELVAEGFAVVLGHFQVSVEVDELTDAFRYRWPDK